MAMSYLCQLCEVELDNNSKTILVDNKTYTVCESCAIEFDKAKLTIEKEIIKTRKTKIIKWLDNFKAVKRFYKRQLIIKETVEDKVNES
jgi:ribosome-binding protein aMBF1 (putative translation factor)